MDMQQQHRTDLLFRILLLLILLSLVLAAILLRREARQEGTELELYIQETEAGSAALQEEITRLRQRISTLQEQETAGETMLQELSADLSALQISSGRTALQGPGLLIRLEDNNEGAEQCQKTKPSSYNPASYIVHDKDLLYLVRAMAPEAEAISINGLRLGDSSSIRCLGSVILVDSTRLAPPYEIKAIGDPERLRSALQSSDRYRSLLRTYIPVEVQEKELLEVPARSGAYALSYGRSPKEPA